MANALGRVKAAQNNAMDSGSAYAQQLARLGVNAREFAAASPDDALVMIARAYKDSEKSADGYALVMDTFGSKLAPKMNEALLEIAQGGMPALIASMKEAGRIMDTEFIASVDKAEAALNRVKQQAKVGVVGIGQTLGTLAGAIFSGSPSAGGLTERLTAIKTAELIGQQDAERERLDIAQQRGRQRLAEFDEKAKKAKEEEDAKRMDIAQGFGIMGNWSKMSGVESMGGIMSEGAPELNAFLNEASRQIQIQEKLLEFTKQIEKNTQRRSEQRDAVVDSGDSGFEG
jgi:hypothetical protein